jgi:zinc protease
LPDDFFRQEQAGFLAVTKADVDRAAKQYLTPDRMTILVIGDRSRIEASLRALLFVKNFRFLDDEGRPVAQTQPAKPRP